MLTLWIALSVAGTLRPVSLEQVQAPAEIVDHRAALIEMVLGGDRICGGEEDPEAAVFCGGELLASVLADPSLLVMSRSTCSLLLERLFDAETCSLAEGGCRALPGNLPPPSPRLSLVPPAVTPRASADLFLLAQARARMRADGDSEPDSRQVRPPVPPPRDKLHV